LEQEAGWMTKNERHVCTRGSVSVQKIKVIGYWLWLSELLFLRKEHGEAYNRAVNEQTSNNAHGHCFDADQIAVCQHDR
jgi:hypothetical protein